MGNSSEIPPRFARRNDMFYNMIILKPENYVFCDEYQVSS